MTRKSRIRTAGQVAAATAGTMILAFLLEAMAVEIIGIAATWKNYALALVLPMIITPVFSLIYVQALRRLHRLKREFEHLASTDPLSGLMNRRAFFLHAQDAIAKSKYEPTTIAVLMVDIDHFKSINDNLGHAVGDLALKMVAQAISSTVYQSVDRHGAVVSRFGGEEFVILVTGLDSAALSQLASRVCNAVRESVLWQGHVQVSTTVSIGIASGSGNEDFDGVLRAGDTALYEAKRTGRDRWCVAVNDRNGLAATLAPKAPISPLRTPTRLTSAA